MKGNDRGGGGFNVIRVCIGIMMLHALVEGANLEAWEKIYDHWELARPEVGLRKECKSDPCSPSCGNFDKYGNGHGVKCTDNYITIIALFTSSFTNRINGSIPAELGELKALTDLDLSNNQLTGSIPAELGELKALSSAFNLKNNQLTPPAPRSVQALCIRLDYRYCKGFAPQCSAFINDKC